MSLWNPQAEKVYRKLKEHAREMLYGYRSGEEEFVRLLEELVNALPEYARENVALAFFDLDLASMGMSVIKMSDLPRAVLINRRLFWWLVQAFGR